MSELKNKWLPLWVKGVARVEAGGTKPFAGHWCHWCRAKNICPVKQESRVEKVANYFNNQPLEGGENGIEEKSEVGKKANSQKSGQEIRKEKSFKTKKEKIGEEKKAAQNFGW
jgi:hypothetical protein